MSPTSQNTVVTSGRHSPRNNGANTDTTNNTKDISPTDARFGVVDEYTRLFGKQLPDPIHLHTEIGTFDGEVIFIAHPNRDVSAHQWSQNSFQWVNVGLYSHNRAKIEGSLAQEHLSGSMIPHNTIEYFKAAAEQRQRLHREYREGYSSELRPDVPTTTHPLEPLRRPTLTDEHFASLSGASDSTEDQLPTLSRFETINKERDEPTTPPPNTVAGEVLEDPFVTPSGGVQHTLPKIFGFAQDNHGESGSMDFGYEFPPKKAAQQSILQSQPGQVFIQREQNRLNALRTGRNIGLREDWTSPFNFNHKRPPLGRLEPLSPMVDPGSLKPGPKTRFSELADAIRQNQPLSHFDINAMHRQDHGLLPAQGRTVANPTRVTSTLNAKAPPYEHTPTPLSNQLRGGAETEVNATYAQPTTNLKFSDPDSTRPTHPQEIANGLAQIAPTPQNFKGPFFTDNMPTPLNPVTSLAYQEDQAAKLRDWYHDGQHPARQQEFARKLMASSLAEEKFRNPQQLGAIGESSFPASSKYENTPIFVRLYENMLKYSDESRPGAKRDYFTHDWQTPLLHQRDLGPDGNHSFYGEKKLVSPFQTRNHNFNLQALAASNWRDINMR